MCAIEAGKRGRRVAVIERADSLGRRYSSPAAAVAISRICTRVPIISCRRIRISRNRRWRAIRPPISSRWWSVIASRITRRRWGNCSATGARGRSWRCCWPSANGRASKSGRAVPVQEVRRPDAYAVRAGDREFRAPALVVATGGLSIPKMGATGLGYDMARQFGVAIRATRPALVPLTFDAGDLRALWRSGGSIGGRGRVGGRSQIPREDAVHASRVERSGDSADRRRTGGHRRR